MDGTPNYTTCYIAFLDLLGFKKIIESKQCEEIVQIFSEIKKQKIKKIFINENGQWKTFIDQDLIQEVKLKIMSDSICFLSMHRYHTRSFCFLQFATCSSSLWPKETSPF